MRTEESGQQRLGVPAVGLLASVLFYFDLWVRRLLAKGRALFAREERTKSTVLYSNYRGGAFHLAVVP